MTTYAYRVAHQSGATSEGMIEAVDERTALERLKGSGDIPLRLEEVKRNTKKGFGLRSRNHLLTFTSELSALLGAGVSLDSSLLILSEIAESGAMKSVIQSIIQSVREGSSLSEALSRHPALFSRIYVNMVRAGEAGGVLDVVLSELNEFLESARGIKDHIFSAMIYPIVLIVTGGISIIILLTYVLPRFSVIFSELGTSVPVTTKVLLSASLVLQSYGWMVLAALPGVWIGFRRYIKTDRGGLRWDALKLKAAGDLLRKIETARFCRTTGTLIKSGVPLLQALNNAKDVVSNRVIAGAIDSVIQDVKQGKGLAMPLTRVKVFPQLAISMIKVGEETGTLDQMLMKVAAAYEKSMKEALKRFVGFLEPALILIMGLIIGFIVVSMLAAVFSIVDLPL